MTTTTALTAKQAETVYLREEEGLTWKQIGERCGVVRGTAEKTYKVAVEKLELACLPIDGVREKISRIDGLVAGWKRHTGGDINDKTLTQQSEAALDALGFMITRDVKGMAGATLAQKVNAWGVLIDKRQLLRGEPTSIMRVEDIRKLDEVGRLLQAEMERRGMMVDVTPEEVDG